MWYKVVQAHFVELRASPAAVPPGIGHGILRLRNRALGGGGRGGGCRGTGCGLTVSVWGMRRTNVRLSPFVGLKFNFTETGSQVWLVLGLGSECVERLNSRVGGNTLRTPTSGSLTGMLRTRHRGTNSLWCWMGHAPGGTWDMCSLRAAA